MSLLFTCGCLIEDGDAGSRCPKHDAPAICSHTLALAGNIPVGSEVSLRRQLAEARLVLLLDQTKVKLQRTESIIRRLTGTVDSKDSIQPSTTTASARPKILLIDDDESALSIAKWALENEDVDVITTTNPYCADIILKEDPDLILVDVNMPVLKGPSVVTAMTDPPRLVGGLVLLHSGIGESELQGMVEKCGAQGYIFKQSNPEAFVEQIKIWLRFVAEKIQAEKNV